MSQGLGLVPIPVAIGLALAAGVGWMGWTAYKTGLYDYIVEGPEPEGPPPPPPNPPPAPPAPETREELEDPALWYERMPERTVEQWRRHQWVPEFPEPPAQASDPLLWSALALGGISALLLLRG